MRTKILFPAVVSALFVLACNSAPEQTGTPAADKPASITTPPVDTVNNRYVRNVEKQIQRDTAKVEDTGGAQ